LRSALTVFQAAICVWQFALGSLYWFGSCVQVRMLRRTNFMTTIAATSPELCAEICRTYADCTTFIYEPQSRSCLAETFITSAPAFPYTNTPDMLIMKLDNSEFCSFFFDELL
jgi:hypothetical protein